MSPGVNVLRESVRRAYSSAALQPQGRHPFPVGVEFAASVGYPREILERIPGEASSAFAGVSNVSVWAPIHEGMAVVDLGCGAGLDSLIAAVRAGDRGSVIGLDFSGEMLARARASAGKAGWLRVAFAQAAAESLPLPAGSIDLIMVNGIFNLNPSRTEIFFELARILKPGGLVAGAELILREELPDPVKSGSANWFS